MTAFASGTRPFLASAEPGPRDVDSAGLGYGTHEGQSAHAAAGAALDPRFVARFLAGMPTEVAKRFDARLLFAVQQAFASRGRQERCGGWHWFLPFRWRGRRWRLSLIPADDDLPPDRRAEALRAARRRGVALGLLFALAAAGLALLISFCAAP